MSDSSTVTTRTGWFSRLGSSLGGILIGLILLGIGVWLLSWNEGRAVKRERALNEGAGVVQTVDANTIDPAHDGALVHTSGDTTVADSLTDSAWPIQVQALRLLRDVEMYQWRETSRSETRTRLGGGQETVTVYEYDRVWSSSPEDSSRFQTPGGHQNPGFPVDAAAFTSSNARLGAYRLDNRIIEQIGPAEALTLDSDTQAALVNQAGRRATATSSELYLGSNPGTPEIGDTRVRWRVVRPGPVSVVAAQTGDGFSPFQSDNGESILLVQSGHVSADQMFEGAQAANRALLWGIRVGGLVLLVIGFSLILNPLRVVADVIPPVGAVIGMGLGLMSLLLGVLLGGVVIAVAWFAVRPLLSVVVLAVAGGIGFLLWRMGRSRLRRQAVGPADPPPPEVAA
ncbi:MAG: TMEM43 family protein [Caulobacterales bacterium]|nr:TMEM43 family protein [Caulobacterales bacterium]